MRSARTRLEVKLQCLFCSGQLSPAVAQHEMFDDWQTAYHRYAGLKCVRSKKEHFPHED